MIGSSYILVVLGILLAKGLGFYRDIVFAGVFGTGVDADIYFQVFGIVNLIFTGIGVALSTLVIKNINKAENYGKEKEYASSFLRKSAFYLTIAVAFIYIFADKIVNIVLPDITGADFETALKLMYVMAPSLLFCVIAYIISGLLQNEKVYFITSIMSLPFNAVIILSLFVPKVSVFSVGVVTTLGWFLHIAILLPSFFKKGYSFFKTDKSVKKKSTGNPEILWIFISNMMFQLCFYIDRAFVSTEGGMASSFNYASNLFVTISSVFVVAMSTVIFPSISKNYEEGNIDYLNELLIYIITIIAVIFLPFLLVTGCFGNDIIRLIYERGSFTSESTKAVSTVFFIYSLGILGYVSQELLNKILYLAGKYKYTVSGTITVIILNIIANMTIKALVPKMYIEALGMTNISLITAVTTSVLFLFYAIAMAVGIKNVVGNYFKKELIFNIIKIFASGGLALLGYIMFNIFAPDFTHGYITFIVPLCVSGVIYLASLYMMGALKYLIKREKKGS